MQNAGYRLLIASLYFALCLSLSANVVAYSQGWLGWLFVILSGTASVVMLGSLAVDWYKLRRHSEVSQ